MSQFCKYKMLLTHGDKVAPSLYTGRSEQRHYGVRNRIPEKLRNMGCKVKKKQCFTDYVPYLSTQYFVIFLEYVSCPVMPSFTSNSIGGR
jgi:hypothetical protein